MCYFLTGNVTYGQDQDCVLTVPLTVWPFLGKSLNICDVHLKNGNSCIITGPTTSLWGLNEIIMHGKHLGQCLALGRFPNASLCYHSKWIPPPTPNVLVRESINLYVFQKLPLFGSMCHWLTGYFILLQEDQNLQRTFFHPNGWLQESWRQLTYMSPKKYFKR